MEKFLLKLVDDYGLSEGYSWWCSSWNDYENSKKDIKKKFIELRKKIKATPCFSFAEKHNLVKPVSGI